MPPSKKKIRKISAEKRKLITEELTREKQRMRNLKLTNPEMFRICGDKPCCQAMTKDGIPCQRPSISEKTYFESVGCCFLCWQHAKEFGVYAFLKVVRSAVEAQLSWDQYCSLYPDVCYTYISS